MQDQRTRTDGLREHKLTGLQKRDAKETKAAAAAAAALAAKKKQTPEELETLKVKKAWEVALGPLKNLPMTGIMMYMSGNSLQIFSIMMVFMAFKNPIMGLLSTQQTFERFETPGNRGKILQVKLAFVAMQFVALALGIWKINGMGLLPYVSPCHSYQVSRAQNTMLTSAEQHGQTGWPGRRHETWPSLPSRLYDQRLFARLGLCSSHLYLGHPDPHLCVPRLMYRYGRGLGKSYIE